MCALRRRQLVSDELVRSCVSRDCLAAAHEPIDDCRNNQNVDKFNSCQRCEGAAVSRARTKLAIYTAAAVVVMIPLTHYRKQVHRYIEVYSPFMLVVRAKLEKVRDKAKGVRSLAPSGVTSSERASGCERVARRRASAPPQKHFSLGGRRTCELARRVRFVRRGV